MADNLADSDLGGSSPVDNLPVAAGKKRRGRPQKQRFKDAAADAVQSTADSGLEATKAAVEEAVENVLKRRKPAGPTTEKGITGIVNQVVRSAVRSAVTSELKADDQAVIGPSVADKVAEVLADREVAEVKKQTEAPKPPHWWMLRQR